MSENTNPTLQTIVGRKSVRVYAKKQVSAAIRTLILQAAMRAPTAGNLMLYSIIEVDDQAKKDTLARTCDNQPFIARAPWVLLFLADYQRWADYFDLCEVGKFARENGLPVRKPQEGDLFMACCDALIAAQTAVITAESLGVGSCYIGDIMENYEEHRKLFNLPPYTFPICLLCFGYPTKAQKERPRTRRFDREFIVFRDSYRRLTSSDFAKMMRVEQEAAFSGKAEIKGAYNLGQVVYRRKFAASFTMEMNRSVRAILQNWRE